MINKKIIFTALAASLIFSPLSTAFAAESSTDESGTVAVADGTGGGSGLSIDLSPGVILSYNSTQNEFALSTTNLSANADNRLEYGIYSAETAYYQVNNTLTTGLTIYRGTLTVGTDPFAVLGWTNMGGGS